MTRDHLRLEDVRFYGHHGVSKAEQTVGVWFSVDAELAVDLERQTVTAPGGESFEFDIDPFAKHCLMNGLDEIGLTLRHAEKITAFEAKHRSEQPWLFG